MRPVLCIDTATKACSVSVFSEKEVLAEQHLIEEGYVHAEQLHVIIDQVLTQADIKPMALSAIAVGKGPGSYTGLRIGVSSAKGLAYGAQIPLLSVPTLQIISAHALELESIKEGILRPLLDARRMEVYSAAYSIDLIEQSSCKALLLEEDPFKDELDNGLVYFFGDGMVKAREGLGIHPNARFIEGVFPKSSSVRELIYQKLDAGELEDVAYFEPFYLKDFIAKLPKKMV